VEPYVPAKERRVLSWAEISLWREGVMAAVFDGGSRIGGGVSHTPGRSVFVLRRGRVKQVV
jgi:hypothetical protein